MDTISVQDRKVPTFIPYEVTANGEIKQKRKRKVQDLEKRKKKQKVAKKEFKQGNKNIYCCLKFIHINISRSLLLLYSEFKQVKQTKKVIL
jgi:hypothetical protein